MMCNVVPLQYAGRILRDLLQIGSRIANLLQRAENRIPHSAYMIHRHRELLMRPKEVGNLFRRNESVQLIFRTSY